jgi:hypothetical protein
VCPQWERYEQFLADMGRRPSSAHSLDRKDNDGDYTPENCRWATVIEQARNQQKRLRVTIDGETRLACEWADSYGISRALLYHRLSGGWDPKRAVETPSWGGKGVCRRGHPKEPYQRCRVCNQSAETRRHATGAL